MGGAEVGPELPDMYKIVVLVPRRDDVDLDKFMSAVVDAAYEIQDTEYADRPDWDIHCYGTREEDDHKWLYKNQDQLILALMKLNKAAASLLSGSDLPDQDQYQALRLAIREADETIEDLL